jgi:hypothetical protein
MIYDMLSHKSRLLTDELGDYPQWSPDGKFVYFNSPYWNSRGIKGGVYRWNASTNATELMAAYPDFILTGLYGVAYSITPAGQILLLRDVSTRDLYALDVDLP